MEMNAVVKRFAILGLVLVVTYPIWSTLYCELQVAYLRSYWNRKLSLAVKNHLSVDEFENTMKDHVELNNWRQSSKDLFCQDRTNPACIFARYDVSATLKLDEHDHIVSGSVSVSSISF
jgi:hypothetical protein